MTPLPIDPLLPELVEILRVNPAVVLRAEPGAGKTTRVPVALLTAGLAGDKHVVVLEPRRIAARAAAAYIAREQDWTLGTEVGYRVRFDQRGGVATRLWFLTEGVLGRQLVRDPFLETVGVIVLDEFHERHLQSDVALAIVHELQQSVRPDLKLVVMSATLETERLAAYLGAAPVCTATGRIHPVTISYAAGDDDRPLDGRVATAVRMLLTDSPDGGDTLVFLPGAGEIHRCAAALAAQPEARACDVVPLHGSMSLEAQHRALNRGGRRRIVLATNVAETALTIDGVTTVIDSGLARVSRLDARRGINALRLVPISRASADQRAGRAGRTAPGRCLRLWTAAENVGRREREVPEILRLDLTATVLEMQAWGLRAVADLGWLDPPPPAALAHAHRLLVQLGALDEATLAVTPLGTRLLTIAAHPRVGRVLLEAERLGDPAGGALLAALASERDLLLEHRQLGGEVTTRWPDGSSDLLLRAERFCAAAASGLDAGACRRLGLDVATARAVERARVQFCRVLEVDGGRLHPPDENVLLQATLAGFPDRVVRRRHAGAPRGLMVGGTGVTLDPRSVVRDAELFVAVDVEASRGSAQAEALVRVASAVRREWLSTLFPNAIRSERLLVFDPDGERVVERAQQRYEGLVLTESTTVDVDRAAAGQVLAAAVRRHPQRALDLERAASLLERVRFLATLLPDLALPADREALVAQVADGLCAGKRSFAELRAADVEAAVRAILSPPQRAALERDAPASLVLPSGRRVPISYERDKPPAVAARIQELFGLQATPRLARGRVPLVIEILAPNQRPVQITDDLESFWRRTYSEVRKQLRGRYPKHPWPEDPLHATPTSRRGRG